MNDLVFYWTHHFILPFNDIKIFYIVKVCKISLSAVQNGWAFTRTLPRYPVAALCCGDSATLSLQARPLNTFWQIIDVVDVVASQVITKDLCLGSCRVDLPTSSHLSSLWRWPLQHCRGWFTSYNLLSPLLGSALPHMHH